MVDARDGDGTEEHWFQEETTGAMYNEYLSGDLLYMMPGVSIFSIQICSQYTS